MIRNYLKIAFRNLRRQKCYAFINITGLAVSIACCLLIGLFIHDEFSYDRFHEKSERIYRVLQELTAKEQNRTFAVTPVPLAKALEKKYPEVQRAVRIDQISGIIQLNERSFEETLLFVDVGFFDLFTFPLAQGNPNHVLGDPNSIVLSPSAARTYFGRTDVVGQPLTIDVGDLGRFTFTVAGVTEPVPSNSSIQFNVLLPISKLARIYRPYKNPRWGPGSVVTYLQLSGSGKTRQLEKKFSQLLTDHRPSSRITVDLHLQPLTDVHFTPGLFGTLQPERTSRRSYSYILAGIGLFILLIACINFMTLTLGRSASRVGEVGVRKVVGARRTQLMGQFWGEALLTIAFAVAVALLLTQLALPVFGRLVGKELSLNVLADPVGLVAVGGFILVVGLIAGSYPAVYLSRFRPAQVLNGLVSAGRRHRMVRRLIVVQFTLAIGLIIGTITMEEQLELIQSKSLGFDEEQVVLLDVAKGRQGYRVIERYRNALADEPRIRSVSGSSYALANSEGIGFKDTSPFRSDGKKIRAHSFDVAPGILKTLGIEVLQGRGFSTERTSGDGSRVIVNEVFVRAFGWENPLSRSVDLIDGTTAPVIGVVEDFHFQSLRFEIEPLVIKRSTDYVQALYIRISPGNPSEAVNLLRSTWREVAPNQPFRYTFLDQQIQQQYRTEERWAKIITWAAIFAIGIACLGLFGLSMLAAARRTKEIGIRKVLGASVTSIVALLSRDFLKLVLVSFVLATPMAYFTAERWLQEFAYRIEVGPSVFLLAGLIAVAVAFLTVSYQAIRAALTNPADALRYE